MFYTVLNLKHSYVFESSRPDTVRTKAAFMQPQRHTPKKIYNFKDRNGEVALLNTRYLSLPVSITNIGEQFEHESSSLKFEQTKS